MITYSSVKIKEVESKGLLWETAISVQKACLWLLEHQNADGSWGVGMLEQSRLTPLITNSLLSCGLSADDERIAKALSWISRNRLSIQEPASLAFAVDSFLRAEKEDVTLNFLLQDLISMQKEDGSWEESVVLTSISILAIKSSRLKGSAESIDRACKYLFRIRVNGTWPWDTENDDDWIEPASYLVVALTESGKYNESVHEVIRWLREKVNSEKNQSLSVTTIAILAWALATEDPTSQSVTRALSWIIDSQEGEGSWNSVEETGFVTFFLHRIVGSVPISSLRPSVDIEVSPHSILAVKGVSSVVNVTFALSGGLMLDPKVQIGSSQLLAASLVRSYVNETKMSLNDIRRLCPGESLKISVKITAISDQEASLSLPVILSGADFFGNPVSWSSGISIRVTKKGFPEIKVTILPEKGEVEEGEYIPLYLQIENIGTAPAFSLNYSLSFYPAIVEIKSGSLNLSIDKLNPGDKLISAFVLKGLEPRDESELLSIEAEVEYVGGKTEGKAGVLVKRISFWEKYSNDILGAVLGAVLGFVFTVPASKYFKPFKKLLNIIRQFLTKR
ncbi:MAG: hypothetical protein DRN92_00740 [Thermoproteota archaeon]|nr:MAG: hypothetical protein DRN92_00740 [Candidatus Korarchaeota archaeon]